MTKFNERRIAKFIIVGLINTAINLAVLNVLIWSTGLGHVGVSYAVFQGIGFLVASLNSYILNKQWTFQETNVQRSTAEFVQFLGISGIGLCINLMFALLLVTVLHRQMLPAGTDRFVPSLGTLFGTLISQFWNYHGYRNIFRKKF